MAPVVDHRPHQSRHHSMPNVVPEDLQAEVMRRWLRQHQGLGMVDDSAGFHWLAGRSQQFLANL